MFSISFVLHPASLHLIPLHLISCTIQLMTKEILEWLHV